MSEKKPVKSVAISEKHEESSISSKEKISPLQSDETKSSVAPPEKSELSFGKSAVSERLSLFLTKNLITRNTGTTENEDLTDNENPSLSSLTPSPGHSGQPAENLEESIITSLESLHSNNTSIVKESQEKESQVCKVDDESKTSSKKEKEEPFSPLQKFSKTIDELRAKAAISAPHKNSIVSDDMTSGSSKLESLKSTLRSTRKDHTLENEGSTSELSKKLKYDVHVTGRQSLETSSSEGDWTERKPQFREDTALLKSVMMRFEYGSCPKTCEKYLDIEEYANEFVNELTNEALTKGKCIQEQTAIRVVEGIEYKSSSDESVSIASIGTYVCILEWPTIEQFTMEIGIDKINEYLSYWKLQEDWKFCVNFLYGESDAACDFYRYEAIFSLPCKQYPIPQATASVYFTFELSRIRPRHCLVDMYYCFEGRRMIHRPESFTFQENRLLEILDAKIKFYQTLRY